MKSSQLPIFIFLSFLSSFCFAQQLPKPIRNTFKLGTGFENVDFALRDYRPGNFFSSRDDDYYKNVKSRHLFLKYEYNLNKHVLVGANFALAQGSMDNYLYEWVQLNDSIGTYVSTKQYEFRFTNVSLNGRINFSTGGEKFAGYAGLGAGIRRSFHTYDYPGISRYDYRTDKDGFPVGFEITMGIQAALVENLGLYSEIGLAKSYFQFGVYYKFK